MSLTIGSSSPPVSLSRERAHAALRTQLCRPRPETISLSNILKSTNLSLFYLGLGNAEKSELELVACTAVSLPGYQPLGARGQAPFIIVMGGAAV